MTNVEHLYDLLIKMRDAAMKEESLDTLKLEYGSLEQRLFYTQLWTGMRDLPVYFDRARNSLLYTQQEGLEDQREELFEKVEGLIQKIGDSLSYN